MKVCFSRTRVKQCLKMCATPPAPGWGILFGQKNSPDDRPALLQHILWQRRQKAVSLGKRTRPLRWKASFLLPQTKPLHHGEDWQGSDGTDPKLCGPGRGVSDLWGPHVESDLLHRSQHRHRPGSVGRSVDELCDAEHRTDAVQAERFCDEAVPGSASCPSSGHHIPPLRLHRLHSHLYRSQVHWLPEERLVKGQGGDHRRLSHHCFRHPRPDPRLLVFSNHHHRLSEPLDPPDAETGNRSLHLHWLGRCCNSSDRWDHPNHFMPSTKAHVWIPRLPTSTNVPLPRPRGEPSNIWPCVCSPIQPTIHSDRDICAHQTVRSTNYILYWELPLDAEGTQRG